MVSLLSSLIFSCLVLAALSMPVHDCIHDHPHVSGRAQEHYVQASQKYFTPQDSLDSQAGQAYAPIRIAIDSRFVSIANATVKNFLLTKLVPEAISWLQKTLSVIRVTGPLILQKQCRKFYEKPYKCIEYWPTSCLDVKPMPEEHFTAGVPNADLLLYVTSKETEGSTLAYAAYCQGDQKNRPIAGNINFGPAHLSVVPVGSQLWYYQLSTAIHEIAHVLGFSANSFGKFLQPNGQAYPVVTQDFQERGDKVTKLVTPKLVKAAAQQFGCSNLNGVELENKGGSGSVGSHFKKRIYMEEFMTALHSSIEWPVYSALTLALFEDSGWYVANYSMATPLRFGLGKGCNFALGSCIQKGVSVAPDTFCTSNAKYSCTPDRRARAVCDLSKYNNALPTQYQYFSDPLSGGSSESMDFCPTWVAFTTDKSRDSLCAEPGNQPDVNYWGETYGSSSRCFESTVVDQKFQRYFINQGATCNQYSCSGGLKVKVGTTWLDCSVPGVKTVPGFNGNFTCPPANVVCY
eukprot:TRINITY_DN5070_c0_g1_i2.p1 TRINITY_DN5070_c0_g1~~TRINITY_DN5070_c0_g1_i2.p1  ORF type:complete len:518 (+),score=130.20 TRINITY_DN5070_c0_g1_i2:78-1631(+)